MPDKWNYIDSKYARPASGKRSVRPRTQLTNMNSKIRGEDWLSKTPRRPRTHLSGKTAEIRRALVRQTKGKELTLEEQVLLSKLRPR